MSRLRDRVVRTVGTRGELTLYELQIAQLVCMSSDFRETGRVPGHVRLDHVVIAVSHWDRSIRFYRDVMGAQVVDHPDGRVAFRFGNQQLNVHGPGLDMGTLVASPPVAPGGSDLCFVWPGTMDTLALHLAAHGVVVEDGPVVRHGGAGAGNSIYFRDPDGSLLEYIVYSSTERPDVSSHTGGPQ